MNEQDKKRCDEIRLQVYEKKPVSQINIVYLLDLVTSQNEDLEDARAYIEVNEQHESTLMENYKDAIARSEALERAIKYPDYLEACYACKNRNGECKQRGCKHNWQFDEAHFSKGGGEE